MVAFGCARTTAGRRPENPVVFSRSASLARRPGGDLLDRPRWSRDRPRRSVSRSPPTPTDEGLAASQVWHVLQDRRGYLWVSTTWGLCRWDGVSFGTLSIPDGLPSATVRITIEAVDGTLWIGTNGGIASYDGQRIVSYADRGGALAGTIWSGALDRHGVLWFGGDRGLVSCDGKEFRTFRRSDGLADDYVYSLLAGERRLALARVARQRGCPLHARTRRPARQLPRLHHGGRPGARFGAGDRRGFSRASSTSRPAVVAWRASTASASRASPRRTDCPTTISTPCW